MEISAQDPFNNNADPDPGHEHLPVCFTEEKFSIYFSFFFRLFFMLKLDEHLIEKEIFINLSFYNSSCLCFERKRFSWHIFVDILTLGSGS